MFENTKSLKHAAILQIIAEEISCVEPISLTANMHVGALHRIAADLIVESATIHATDT
jgi:hypothetical protein